MQLGISGLIRRPDWWAGEAGAYVVLVPAAADPIAIEAHCMGFGVPAPSSLRKDPEEVLTIRACRLFGLVRSGRDRRRGLFRWHLL